MHARQEEHSKSVGANMFKLPKQIKMKIIQKVSN